MDDMKIMQIPVKDLVIDMTVSDAHVAVIKRALLADGCITEPITVWWNGEHYRIANGFHRVIAARQLGWETVPCNVLSGTEERFWNARIIAAKLHAEVSDDRLKEWMVECWKASKWGMAHPPAHGEEPGIAAVLEAICELGVYECSQDLELRSEETPTWDTAEQQELYRWLKSRGDAWDIHVSQVIHVIFGAFLRRSEKAHIDSALMIAHETGIRDASEALEVARAHISERRMRHVHLEDVSAWRQIPPESRPPLADFIDARRDEEARAKEAERKATEAGRHKREEAFRQTPEYRIQQQQTVRQILMGKYDTLDAYVDENALTLAEMPVGPDLLAAQAEWALQKIAEMWPGAERDDMKVPTILAENVRLRAELAKEHKARIEAEEAMARMAGATDKIEQRKPDVMAWSSSIVEALAE